MKTSLSDDMEYSKFSEWCKENQTEKALINFRRDSVYSSVVPSYPIRENGLYFYNELKAKYPHLLENKKFFEKTDFGNPRMFEYDGIGLVDPVVLRMILIYASIEEHIGFKGVMSICEIGPGNGLLFKIITDIYPNVRYTFIDLDGPMFFLKKNIEYYEKEKNIVGYLTCEQVMSEPYVLRAFDMVLSECAFNECYIDVQEAYMDKIINPSRSGRILCNDIMFEGKDVEHMDFRTIFNSIKRENKIVLDWENGTTIMWR